MNVYLDYAATAPLLPEALEAMLPFLKGEFGNPDSLHAHGRRAAYAVAEARDRIAAAIGADPAEIYFTSGGTEADNWAVRGLGTGEALLSPLEHAAVLSALALREGGGEKVSAAESGIVPAERFARAATERTGLVCLMAVNNETGCVQPVGEVSALAHARGALFFTDCVQAACSQDLKKIYRDADALSLSAHKVGGPKGVGALVVKRGVPLRPLIAGGEQEQSLRGGTLNVAGIVGFSHALAAAQERREAFCARTAALRDAFEREIVSALGDAVRIDGENRAPNISHLTFEGGGGSLVNVLDLKGISCSGGAACSAHAAQPSHVMLAMGRSPAQAKKGVRFSFGAETTEEEARFAARTVIGALS